MGAEVFVTHMTGNDAPEAFFEAVRRAQYEYGHGGYTGTIAEKNDFALFHLPKDVSYEEWWDALMQATRFPNNRKDPLIAIHGEQIAEQIIETFNDKWGPAVALQIADNKFVFTGWASC